MTQTLQIDDTIYGATGGTITLDVGSVPEATAYAWTFNDAPIEDASAQTYAITSLAPEKIGTYACTVTTNSDPVTKTYVVGIAEIAVSIAAHGETFVISDEKFTLGGIVDVVYTPEGDHASYNVAYQWLKDGSNASGTSTELNYMKTAASGDSGAYTLKVTVTGKGQTIEKTSEPITVTVKEKVPCEAKMFIHALPHRNTSFMWIGYWVLDELKKLKEESTDWYTNFSATKYSRAIETICYGLSNYGDVLLMESRNGYIYSARDFLVK